MIKPLTRLYYQITEDLILDIATSSLRPTVFPITGSFSGVSWYDDVDLCCALIGSSRREEVEVLTTKGYTQFPGHPVYLNQSGSFMSRTPKNDDPLVISSFFIKSEEAIVGDFVRNASHHLNSSFLVGKLPATSAELGVGRKFVAGVLPFTLLEYARDNLSDEINRFAPPMFIQLGNDKSGDFIYLIVGHQGIMDRVAGMRVSKPFQFLLNCIQTLSNIESHFNITREHGSALAGLDTGGGLAWGLKPFLPDLPKAEYATRFIDEVLKRESDANVSIWDAPDGPTPRILQDIALNSTVARAHRRVTQQTLMQMYKATTVMSSKVIGSYGSFRRQYSFYAPGSDRPTLVLVKGVDIYPSGKRSRKWFSSIIAGPTPDGRKLIKLGVVTPIRLNHSALYVYHGRSIRERIVALRLLGGDWGLDVA